MKRKYLLTLTLVLFFTIITSAQAPPPPPPPPPGLPIDGGIAFLIIAGVAYGIKKIRD
tara:strand:+ start:9654 stop:9827 length:174 start_codon:yes stop_codon:yes gene_type:complete